MPGEKELLQKALKQFSSEAEKKALMKNRTSFVTEISKDVIRIFTPLFKKMSEESRLSKEELKTVAREIAEKISIPEINIPEMILPAFPEIPEPKVNVDVAPPIVNVAKPEMPEEMTINGWIGLMGYDKGFLDNPLPVQILDGQGNPVDFGGGMASVGGGGFRNIKIGGVDKSAFSEYINGDGRFRVSVETGGSGLTDNELRASSVPIAQASGATWSVSTNDMFRTTVATNLINADDRLRVSLETGGSGLTDSELRASGVPMHQVSGFAWSVYVKEIFGSVATDIVNPDGRLKVEMPAGSSGLTDAELRALSVPVSQVSGASDSVYVTGYADSVTVHKIMVTNPTAKADGADIRPRADDVGRALSRPIQVRDLLQTAYVTEDEVGEVTILAGTSGVFHDLVYLMGANESDAAINIDIRQTTGGTVQATLTIPANSTAGLALSVPIPQDHADATWTAQNNASDNSNTIYSITALFSKEV